MRTIIKNVVLPLQFKKDTRIGSLYTAGGNKLSEIFAGKVKRQTPIWECGRDYGIKPKGRAGKRKKYNIRFNKENNCKDKN